MTTDVQTLEAQIREAEGLCDRLLEEIANIKEQIARAATNARQTGNYGDSDWYHSANRALRHKQAAHQKALRDTASLRREIKRLQRPAEDAAGRTFERAFMVEAKAALPDGTYRMIIDRVQAGGSQ